MGGFWAGVGAVVQSHPGTSLTWLAVLSPIEGVRFSYKTDPEECEVQVPSCQTYISSALKSCSAGCSGE